MLTIIKQPSLIKGLVASLFTVLAVSANSIHAEDALTSTDLNSGRGGEAQRVDDGTEFKVCADPENMPYSNTKGEGFENKIAEVLAKDLGLKLTYQFWYDRMGFIRNTLNAKRCDVIMGTTSDNDSLRTSKPYYRSGHVFVWRKESNFNITDWDSPDLKKGVIGIVGQSPATIPMNEKGLIANARPYRMQRDLNLPPSFLIDDLANKEIDIVVAWGPIGGYFAKINNKNYEIIYRDDKSQMYDLFENNKKIKSNKSIRNLMKFPKMK
jgi:mxaJ protein